ncbi:MAG: hypothetical protein AABX75_01170, partial [Nanoarchaeota archaeon]
MGLRELELAFATRVLCDVRAPRLDLAYLFAQTSDNERSVFAAGAHLYGHNPGLNIGLCGSENTNHGYPGLGAWRDKLFSQPYEINAQCIIPIPHPNAPNTLSEAETLVNYAKENGMTHLGIVAPPFHLPRAFITIVTVVRDEYPKLKIYSVVGTTLPWDEVVRHSQGVTTGKRSELISGEWERIRKYQKEGDRLLCSV